MMAEVGEEEPHDFGNRPCLHLQVGVEKEISFSVCGPVHVE